MMQETIIQIGFGVGVLVVFTGYYYLSEKEGGDFQDESFEEYLVESAYVEWYDNEGEQYYTVLLHQNADEKIKQYFLEKSREYDYHVYSFREDTVFLRKNSSVSTQFKSSITGK